GRVDHRGLEARLAGRTDRRTSPPRRTTAATRATARADSQRARRNLAAEEAEAAHERSDRAFVVGHSSGMDARPELTEEQIEKMRAIGLRLDRGGTFWHQGAQVTHPRLRQALLRWLDVRDDGRDIVRLDERRYAYVEIEDAHLRALGVRWDGDRCFERWDDD